MSKVILSGHLLVAQDDLAAVRAALPIHCDLTRAEPGCLVFQVSEDPNQVGKFDVYEEFDSRESFQRHQQRAAESDWATVSRNAQRIYSVSEGD